MKVTSALKEAPGRLLAPSTTWGYREKFTVCHDSTFTRTQPYWHPDLELLVSRTVRNRFLLFMNYSVSSVAQLCPTLCDPMDCSKPGFPVHHQFLDFAQTHGLLVGNAVHLSHPLLSPSPPAFNLFQHQGLFKWVSILHQVAKVFELQLQHQSLQWIFRVDFL